MPVSAWYNPWAPPIFAAPPPPPLPLPPLPPVFPWGVRPLIFAATDASQPAPPRQPGPPQPLPAPGLLNSLLTARLLSGQRPPPLAPAIANGREQNDRSQARVTPQATTVPPTAIGGAARFPAGMSRDVGGPATPDQTREAARYRPATRPQGSAAADYGRRGDESDVDPYLFNQVDWSRFNRKYPDLPPRPDDHSFGELKPATYSPSQRIGNAVADLLTAAGMQPYTANDLTSRVGNVLNMFPPIGVASAAMDALHAQANHDTIGVLKAMPSLIPGGKLEAQAIEQGISAAAAAPLFKNLAPFDALDAPKVFPAGEIRRVGYNGTLNYVVTGKGQLVLGRSGHIDLSRGADVLAAGEAYFVNGRVRAIDNASGHYRPSGSSAQSAAEAAFSGAGFDAAGKYIERN